MQNQPEKTETPKKSAGSMAGGILLLGLIFWGIHSLTEREPPTLRERLVTLAKHKPAPEDIAAGEAQRLQFRADVEKARQEKEAIAVLPRLGDRTDEAFLICKHHIENRLKSPRSAQFTLSDYRSIHLGDERYESASYVDAQNSFGAEIRTRYQCTLQYTGPTTRGANAFDPTNWRLISLATNP